MTNDISKEIYLDIRRANDELIYSNFSEENHKQFEYALKNKTDVKVRILEKKGYKVKFLTKDSDLINSNKLFNKAVKLIDKTIDFYIRNISRIESENEHSLDRLEHNLSTYNALILQEVEVLIPQSKIAGKLWKEKLAFVQKQLSRNTMETAETFLRISKYAQGIKSELTAYDLLIANQTGLKLEKHEIYRVILNSLYNFFPDFYSIGVEIKMQHHNIEGKFNYDSLSVVLFHLFNNATKYCLPQNPINISIRPHGDCIKIEFSMLSLRIEDSETKDIFKEGFSGKSAMKANLNGRGVGMYVARELMKLNQGEIEVNITRSTNQSLNGNYYELNNFILTLLCA